MRFIALILIALIAASPARADSYRFRGGLVMDGDSVATLVQRAGQPNRIVPIENKFGAVIGETWEYYIDRKMVSFVISGGKVLSITETR